MIDEELVFPEKEAFIEPAKEYAEVIDEKSVVQVAVDEVTDFNKNGDPVFKLRKRSFEEKKAMLKVFFTHRKGELAKQVEEAEKTGEIEIPKDFKNKIEKAQLQIEKLTAADEKV